MHFTYSLHVEEAFGKLTGSRYETILIMTSFGKSLIVNPLILANFKFAIFVYVFICLMVQSSLPVNVQRRTHQRSRVLIFFLSVGNAVATNMSDFLLKFQKYCKFFTASRLCVLIEFVESKNGFNYS